MNPVTTDPATLRAIDQLAGVVNDVETHLNLVKLALAQSVIPATNPFANPFSGPSIPGANLATLLANVTRSAAAQTPYTAFFGQTPFVGSPFVHATPFSPLAGVNAPIGIANPFTAPGLPFRL